MVFPCTRLFSVRILDACAHLNTCYHCCRSNIEAHYDLSNELFKTFLDVDYMLYSCGIFQTSMGRCEDSRWVVPTHSRDLDST